MNLKLGTLAAVIACMLPCSAIAQTAVPLEKSLLQWTWSIIDFPGKSTDSPAPTFHIDEDLKNISGTTSCGSEWWADAEINLPKIKIIAVHGSAYDCSYAKEVSTFLNALETANHFRTSPEGLEVLKSDGSRLLLMVTGG